jgi:hypothetical protein
LVDMRLRSVESGRRPTRMPTDADADLGGRGRWRIHRPLAEMDPEVQTYDAAFRKRLDELGWIDGRNIHIDYRWGAGSVERMRLFAKELGQLSPEAIFTFTTPATAALQAETSTIPIVFWRLSH